MSDFASWQKSRADHAESQDLKKAMSEAQAKGKSDKYWSTSAVTQKQLHDFANGQFAWNERVESVLDIVSDHLANVVRQNKDLAELLEDANERITDLQGQLDELRDDVFAD